MNSLRKRSHQWIDARSLDLARAIAEKIRKDPGLLDTVRLTLSRWKERKDPWPRVLREWEEILCGHSVDDILGRLLDDSEEGRRLRQSSPFTAILTPQERKVVMDRYEAIGT